MDHLKLIRVLVRLIFLAIWVYEFVHIIDKVIGKDSFQAITDLNHEKLRAPTITLCPGLAWKSPGPFLGPDDFLQKTFTWSEIFHPKTLKVLKNESLFHIEETYSSYNGLCFTLQKLAPEKISDYSFQVC